MAEMRLTDLGGAWSDAQARSPTGPEPPTEEHVTMSTETHTTAGLLALAGAARLGAVTPAGCSAASLTAAYGVVGMHQVSGDHQVSTWTKGAIAEPITFPVFSDGKNRPTRPLSERSP
jgi:hypothetical protein